MPGTPRCCCSAKDLRVSPGHERPERAFRPRPRKPLPWDPSLPADSLGTRRRSSTRHATSLAAPCTLPEAREALEDCPPRDPAGRWLGLHGWQSRSSAIVALESAVLSPAARAIAAIPLA